MSGCFTTLELTPQGPADVAALARAEAHAQGCSACAARLAALREVEAALTEGLRCVVSDSLCPEPEALAEWIDAGRPSDAGELIAHLSTCAECRADLLDAIIDEDDDQDAGDVAAPVRAPSRRSRRAARARNRPRVLEAAVAAGLVGLSLTYWAASRPANRPIDPGVVASAPAPSVTKLPLSLIHI